MTDRLPHEKGFHVSWDQIHRDARALAWRLDGKGPGEGGVWKAVVGITRGGLGARDDRQPRAGHPGRRYDQREKSYDHSGGAPISAARRR